MSRTQHLCAMLPKNDVFLVIEKAICSILDIEEQNRQHFFSLQLSRKITILKFKKNMPEKKAIYSHFFYIGKLKKKAWTAVSKCVIL